MVMSPRTFHPRIAVNDYEAGKHFSEADPPMINGCTPCYNIITTHEFKTTFSLTHWTTPHIGSSTISDDMNASESQYPMSK